MRRSSGRPKKSRLARELATSEKREIKRYVSEEK